MHTRRRTIKLTAAAFLSKTFFPHVARADGEMNIETEIKATLQSFKIPPFVNTNDTKIMNVDHAFSKNDFSRLSNMEGCVYIVQNGVDAGDHPDFVKVTGPVYHTTVFANDALGAVALSTAQLDRILRGRVTNWSELGYADAPINVALNVGEFDQDHAIYINRYKRTLINAGIKMADPFENAVKYSSYEQLQKFGKETPGALLIGLRAVEFSGITPVELDGAALLSTSQANPYPLQMRSQVSVRRSEAAVQSMLKIVDQAMANHTADAANLANIRR